MNLKKILQLLSSRATLFSHNSTHGSNCIVKFDGDDGSVDQHVGHVERLTRFATELEEADGVFLCDTDDLTRLLAH